MNENAAEYFVDRHCKEGRGAKVAFLEADGQRRSLSYEMLFAESGRFAGALLRSGMRREERMAMIVLDQLEFPIAFWGAMKAGVVPIPINTLLSTQVYETILMDSRATMLMVSQALWETVKPAIAHNPHLRQVIIVGAADDHAISFEEFMSGSQPAEAMEVSGDELAFWLYSSGSTGAPKGVKHVHSSLKATSDTFGHNVLGIGEDDVVYSIAKLFFAYGLGNAMTFPMAVGASTILWAGRPTPASTLEVMKNERPTIFCGVPTLYAALVAAQEKTGGLPYHCVRLGVSAGEALPREIGERFEKLWQAEIIDGVGSTEMLHIFLSNQPGKVVYGTSGVAVPGYDLRLVDEKDQDVAPGEIGELLVRGASSADGYWNRREKSRATFLGAWTRTGDKYEMREDGRFVYCGRTDDMFKVSGIWVSPFEIEQALIEHPAILEAAVVGRADQDKLIKPAAFVVIKDPNQSIDAESLKEFVKDKIGKWKYPRWVEIVDGLPKTATGKIQRFKLRG